MTGFPNLDCYYNNYLYNDRLDWLSSKLIVLFGNNPAGAATATPTRSCSTPSAAAPRSSA